MAARKTPEPTEATSERSVTVETPDLAVLEKERREKVEAEHAAALRRQQVEGLETELAYLKRTLKPNAARIADVEEQISVYSATPKRTRETR